MWEEPKETMAKMPGLYGTEAIPTRDKLIWVHFYITGTDCHWWAAEFDHKGGDIFFGFASLGDLQNAEWGYFSLSELKSILIGGFMEVEWEIEWEVRPASQVETICKAHGWQMPNRVSTRIETPARFLIGRPNVWTK